MHAKCFEQPPQGNKQISQKVIKRKLQHFYKDDDCRKKGKWQQNQGSFQFNTVLIIYIYNLLVETLLTSIGHIVEQFEETPSMDSPYEDEDDVPGTIIYSQHSSKGRIQRSGLYKMFRDEHFLDFGKYLENDKSIQNKSKFSYLINYNPTLNSV